MFGTILTFKIGLLKIEIFSVCRLYIAYNFTYNY